MLSAIKKLLKQIFPRYTKRRLIFRILRESLYRPWRVGLYINQLNIANFRQASRTVIKCNVCGDSSKIFYDMPNVKLRMEHEIGILRETLNCIACGATMRHRAMTSCILRAINQISGRAFISLKDYANSDCQLKIYDTDSFSPMNSILSGKGGYISSVFDCGYDFGVEIKPKIFNINLESISFPSKEFDIILTSDVMEHVRHDDLAHSEIYRCLKIGGVYVFTVPFNKDYVSNRVLVCCNGKDNFYLTTPHYHGDPLSGGILAYRVYGQELICNLSEIGFTTNFYDINIAESGIWHGDCFIARKLAL